MEFVLEVLKQGMSNANDLLKLSDSSYHMHDKLTSKKKDFESSIIFLNGGALDHTPEFSIDRLKRQLNWLRYDETLHKKDINEVNECIQKLTNGAKTLSE